MDFFQKIAFIHDWLVTFGGGEQILAALSEIWPDSPIFTLIYDPHGPCREFTEGKIIQTSFLQKLPRSKRNHRAYLPLMPLAVEQFDTRSFDILISCSHAVAHGIIPGVDQLHINYICIPIRYAWHLYQQYIKEAGLTRGQKSVFVKLILHYIRMWDNASSNRVDKYVSISKWVSRNVWRVYRRPSSVIYPPVDLEHFSPGGHKENFYITASRMVPYKRIDIIVEAFSTMPTKKLIVIGDGPELEKVKSKAGKNVEFLGFQPRDDLIENMQRARAFIFAAIEDFGILPVEAQACGTPVIAYGKGGVLETVIDGKTGLFYEEQSTECLVSAVNKFETIHEQFNPKNARQNAERFNKERFQKEFMNLVESEWDRFLLRNSNDY